MTNPIKMEEITQPKIEWKMYPAEVIAEHAANAWFKSQTNPIQGAAPCPIFAKDSFLSWPKSIGEPQPDTWKTYDGRKIKKPTFKKFFTHDEIEEIASSAKVRFHWESQNACGNTLKDKAESFFVYLTSVRQSLILNGAAGLFWLVASPTVCDFMQPTWLTGPHMHNGQAALGIDDIEYHGLFRKMRIYCDQLLPHNTAIMGVNDTRGDNSHYARITASLQI